MADPSMMGDDSLEKLHLSMPNLMHNMKIIEHIRGSLSIMAGAATGILGITGLKVRMSDHVVVIEPLTM